ncbi:MAG: hypothetical protein ACK4M3_05535 [Pyrobaculum sp.]
MESRVELLPVNPYGINPPETSWGLSMSKSGVAGSAPCRLTSGTFDSW